MNRTSRSTSVAGLIEGASAWFLAACRHGNGRRAFLEVMPTGELRLEGDALALDIAPLPAAPPHSVLGMSELDVPDERVPWPVTLAACAAWRMEWLEGSPRIVRTVTGEHERRTADEWRPDAEAVRWLTRFTFTLDPKRLLGDVQSPDVLYALRDQAARWPEARFEVRLPRGTRDLQRARAGLPSGS